jgi:hypothetical protein
MKTITIIIGLLLAGFILVRCTKGESAEPERKTLAAKPILSKAELVKRGEYLVNSIGCDDCHSPKIMGPNGPEVDPERRLSGHPADQKLGIIKDKSIIKDYALFDMGLTAAVGPWGTSFAANLTPDDTGTGNWTEAQFIKAIREGKFKGLDGGRPLLPPMPWFVYKNLTDDDLRSIFAYLQTMKPVSNIVPAAIPPVN